MVSFIIHSKKLFVTGWDQKIYYLTPRYSEEIEVRRLSVTNEWRISSDGYIISNGLPSKIAN